MRKNKVYLKIKTRAGQKTETCTKISENTYEICVREKAQKNQANKRILEILSEILKKPLNDIKIINGHHSPSKLISIKE